MKRVFLGLILSGVVIVTLILSESGIIFNNNSKDLCQNNNLFQVAWKNSPQSYSFANHPSSLYVDGSGNILYLHDNFTKYAENQKIIDDFENPEAWSINGTHDLLQPSDEYYGGSGALFYSVTSHQSDITLSRQFENAQNLTRWSNSGYITMWLKVDDARDIDAVNLSLEDNLGNMRQYHPVLNPHPSSNNTFGNDLGYSDISFQYGDPKTEQWTDFLLAPGWNLLFWRTDDFKDIGDVNISKIQKIYLEIDFNANITKQKLIFDDLRIQDGLQKTSNPTHGMWYPPHGRPQYGVYDIDKIPNSQNDYELRLLNVRNTQYITNGDHARMISEAPVPMDFAAKIKFTLIQLGAASEQKKISFPFSKYIPTSWLEQNQINERNNTYFRVTYDFEPDWDPGHDWFGAYISLEYNKFGLNAVWPITRSILQDQEPKKGDATTTNDFAPLNNVEYEMDLVVQGQQTSATIYEVNGDCLTPQASVGYVFHHTRHGTDLRYPIAIESTGNMRSIIHEVEIVSLEKTNSSNTMKQLS
ncbi:MAG: hypothetical protein HY223_01270 [Thaumarchaeota archaeon]|nr:hypothetical protein [Nitrososphaerota archaeon]